MSKNLSLEILNYKKLCNDRSKIGEVQIKVKIPKDTVIILNKMHHATKNGGDWVNYPAYSEVDCKGKRKFIQYMEFEDRDLERTIRETAMDKLKKYNSEQKTPLFDELPFLQEELPF